MAVAATALLTLTLTGCGTGLNPGAAAQVNDQRIPQSEVDDLVMSACAYSKVAREQANGKDPQTSIAALRQLIIARKVDFALVDEAANQLGITVSQSRVDAGVQSVPADLNGEDAGRVRDFFQAAAKAQLQTAVIGAHVSDPSVVDDSAPMTQQDVTAGKEYMKTYAAKQDVEVNPEFGTWDGTAVAPASGSLSVAVSDDAKDLASAAQSGSVADLPPSQVCG